MLYENMLRFLLITFQPSLLDRTCLKCKTSLRCECWHFLMLLLLYRVNWPYLSKLQRFNEHFSTCQNNRALSASLSFHLRLDPSFWRSWLQKHIWFQTSTRIHQTHRFRKKTTLESGFKSMRFRCADWLVSFGQKADSYKKVSGFVNEPVYVVVGLFYSGLWK